MICWNISIWAAMLSMGQQSNQRIQLQNITKQNGEVFIALTYLHPEQKKECRMEDLFTNTVSFIKDSLIVDYNNYTESFCEAIKLETHLLYRIRLKDLDPTQVILMQRKYNLKGNKLLEGQSAWFEVQLNTVAAKPLITERNLLEHQMHRINQLRLIFKTQESARRAQATLQELIKIGNN